VTTAAPTPPTPPAETPSVPQAPGRRFVRIKNLERQPQTILLDAHGEDASFIRRVRVTVLEHDGKSGEHKARQERRRVPSSITLWGKGREGDESEPLPAAVLRSTDLAPRLRAKRVSVRDVPEPKDERFGEAPPREPPRSDDAELAAVTEAAIAERAALQVAADLGDEEAIAKLAALSSSGAPLPAADAPTEPAITTTSRRRDRGSKEG
jgi:hypothetical protein